MRIHAPETKAEDGLITVSSRVEFEKAHPDIPERIHFSFPDRYGEMIDARVEPFAIALLLFAMGIGEDLQVDGEISPQLYLHLDRYQQIHHLWYPDRFRRIDFSPTGLREPGGPRGAFAAAHFSGGVDSLFTLHREVTRTDPLYPAPLTHGIFVYFDRANHNLDRYMQTAERHGAMFESLGLDLIPVRTNLRRFILGENSSARNRWVNMTYGSGLSAIGMMLSRGIGWLYIASGMPMTYPTPDGSKLVTDHLLSTEKFEVIHHGMVQTRGDKIRAIADWAPSYDVLNVCWWRVDAEKNCGRCPKCVRTLAYFEAIDRADRYAGVFEETNPWDRLRWFTSINESIFTVEILAMARENGKTKLALTAWFGLAVVRVKRFLRSVIRIFRPRYKELNI